MKTKILMLVLLLYSTSQLKAQINCQEKVCGVGRHACIVH